MTIQKGSQAVLSAVGYDTNNIPISGLTFNWTRTDTAGRIPQRTFFGGIFNGSVSGTFTITAESGGQQAQVTITVTPRDPEEISQLNNTERSGTRISSREGNRNGKSKENQVERSNQNNLVLPEGDWNDDNWPSSVEPGNLPGNPPGGPMDGGAGNGNFQLSAPVVSLPGRGIDIALNLHYNSRLWNKSDTELIYDIDKGFPAPGWSLGFGKIVFMGEQGGCMLVDADGTRHGYAGQISNHNGKTNFNGHTADGSFIDYSCYVGYSAPFAWGSGWAKLPNGTTIIYSAGTSVTRQLYPTLITDAQGNFISITYRNNQGPEIATITDTLGRVIAFNYDESNRLISVEVPRMDDQEEIYGEGKTRLALQLHYKPLTLNYSFASGITPVVRQSTVDVIDAIYYPGTQTGYWFDDTDSYSTYGMITKVVEQRGMDWQTGTQTQGDVIAGTMTKQAIYNYPLTTTNESGRTNGVGLTDAPTYTTLTESWAGRDVEEDAVTIYSVNNSDWKNGTPARSITITQPTGVISKQYSHRTPGQWNDGLVFTDETIVMDGSTPVVVGSSQVSWDQGNGTNNINYDSPRPAWAKVFDENGHYVKTVYTYGTNKFNQITKSCDYDNSDTLLRCSTAEYENSLAYTGHFNGSGQFTGGRHVFNLVKSTRIENPDSSIVSRTDYEYDNYTQQPFVDAPDVIQHNHNHNPFTTFTQEGPCIDGEWNHSECEYEGQTIWVGDLQLICTYECFEYDQISVYDSNTEKRGNITKITTYSDAQNLNGEIIETRAYDITGNLVKSSSACCEEISIIYDDPDTPTERENQYAYPLFQIRGSSDPQSPHRITTSAVYSYETGLVKESTDANGLTSVTWYNPDTLRPVRSVSSTGAYTTIAYDDEEMTVEEEVREPDGWGQGPLAGKSKKYLNGIGLIRKEESFAPNDIVDIVEIKYTKFGEEWKQSRPYRSGQTVYWSEKFYDDQRRLIKVVEPDGSTTEAFYNESTLPDSVTAMPGNTIRVVDAWGRERWGRYDQQGRLVHVVEPNPDKSTNPGGKIISGGNPVSGSLLTKYKYDTLGRLVETEQGSQIRKFKYDSLGRLTRQKLAEQTATLNNSGTFVGIGHQDAVWAEAFVYDNRSNLVQKTDARGVRTNFSFQSGGNDDPLNRIQSRSYDISGPLQSGITIHAAPSVAYEYMTTGDKTRIKKIVTNGIVTEDFTYDGESRVSEYKQTVDYRENYPMTTNYIYDPLDRVTEVLYPAHYGLSGNPRRSVVHDYDTASRLTQLTYNSTVQAYDIVYNASDQTTSIKIGPSGTNQVTEEYTFDPQTGLLTNQKAIRNSQDLLDLSYEYNRLGSAGNLSGKTGHLTKIIDHRDTNRNREYEFDALGRLTKAKGGHNGGLWDQNYTYDRYGNRTNVTASGHAADKSPIPLDGIPNLSYDNTSNRITTTGFEYDVAGNQIRALAANGTDWLLYEYDAANRLKVVKQDGTTPTDIQSFEYGSTNARLMVLDYASNQWTIYASTGGTTLAEYTEFTEHTPTWTKSYTYLGDRLLSTVTPNGTGGEFTEFNHPDRLGTKLITNSAGSYEQAHLPFGTALNAESTGSISRRFTSYDRSNSTGLDYAINRTYDSKQGRFTQVDPMGISSGNLEVPQTLNLFSYCGNDPINRTDPDGLFWSAVGRFFKKVGRWISKVAAAVATVLNNRWVRLGFFVLDFVLPGLRLLSGLVARIAEIALKIYTKVTDIVGMIQLAELAVRGKFKQLVISLGIAAAAAPLTALTNGIKKGMQDAIFRGRGFPDLASFFKHAGIGFYKGFKVGWNQMMDGFRRKGLEALIPLYGNYCGPGYPSGGDQGMPGINDLDNKGCRPHDADMAFSNDPDNFIDKPGSRLWFRIKSDLKLIGRAFIFGTSVHSIDIAFGGRPGLGASYKFMLVPSFLFGRIVPMSGRLAGHQIATTIRGGH
ncbi:MAG TPA: RHS repeat-associated core domain-containing protein [Pyrinomonadaceae bacterium]|nr:RHS repeat-associated core domain-containing protein [Pyrinomonadaceae bacterium]HMP64779.1 RHS repeat-associated core domain-containing protein [Pyrinomonadaceae bacterium]